MTVAAAFAVRLRGRPTPAITHPGHAVLSSAGMAILLAATTWVVAAPKYPNPDLPFLVLAWLNIVGAFSLTTWYGWQLRGVDWPDGRTGGHGNCRHDGAI
jgi:hypothetical protein